MNSVSPAEFSSFHKELLISARLVLALLTVVTLVTAVTTAGLGVYSNGVPVLALRICLYLLVIFGWVIYARNETACKWFLILALNGFLYLAVHVWKLPEALLLLTLPVLFGGALLGARGSLFAALLASGGLLWPAAAGTVPWETATVFSLGAVWTVFGLTLAIYRPIHEIGDWILTFHRQAVQMVSDATSYRLELNQAMEELTHMNRQLALANEKQLAFRIMAEEAQKTKAAFVAKVSHEFRTPLNMIIGLVNLMIDTPEIYGRALPKAMVNDLEIIQRNCEHLTGMINDVLALSQAESGKLALNREYVAIQEIIAQAFEVVSPLVRKKGLETGADVPEKLDLVFCDRTRIRQVLLNLVSNAARFTESGGITVTVEDQAGHLLISVRDTGPGITAEDIERIFDPFEQGSGHPPRDRGGTGLGLTISKQFIELHGGKIWVDSQVGQGATFTFTLPKDHQGPLVAPARWISDRWSWISRLGKPHHASEELQKLRLALLDPQGQMGEYLAAYRDRMEYAVTGDLEGLVEEVRRSPVNLVLTNAASVAALEGQMSAICAEIQDTPVVGCIFSRPRLPVADASVVRTLVKPIVKQDLLRAIEGVGKPVRRVLLVDNDLEIIALYQRMLLSAGGGLQVLTANSGRDALERLQSEAVDLILLDLTMPEMDGFAFLEQKERIAGLRELPVIIVSAMDLRENNRQSPFLAATIAQGLGFNKLLECAVGVSEIILKSDAQPG